MSDILIYQSPIGLLQIVADDGAINQISFSAQLKETDTFDSILKKEIVDQLDNYFSGRLFRFNLPLAPVGSNFQKDVWKELQQIEFGQQITYQKLAFKLGDKNLVRAVGGANARNPIAIVIPCHRVIGAKNKLVGYAGGIWRKKWLLQHELNYRTNSTTLF